MALTLTIGGTNFLPQYKTNSLTVRERLFSAANIANLTIVKKPGENTPSEGAELIFKDGTRFLFGGFVTKLDPREVGEGEMIVYSVEAMDYTYILNNKYAQKTYTSQTLAAIVADLLSEYVDSGYAITSNGVQTGPTINTIAFDYLPLTKCFEKLLKVTGYEWYIDYEKDIQFFPKDATPAAEGFTDSSDNFTEIDIACDTSQVRNYIIVRGGREITSAPLEQDILGDGEAREWILREKPKTMDSIKLDTGAGFVTQTVGVDPLNEDTGNDFMFNYQEKYVRCAAAESTPAIGHILRVSYYYEVPIIVPLKSASSIAAMQAIEGGDGIHTKVINNTGIKSKVEAREFALKEIGEYGNPLVTGNVKTRSGLLQSSTVFAPGQYVTVNLPTWGISTSTDYVIQEVRINMIEDGTNIEYFYEVIFGGRLFGIREFLEGLAGQEKIILDTEEINRLEAFEEVLTISESITREPNTKDFAETITIAETITEAMVTPPWKWAPSTADTAKKARWGSFEWGS